MESLAIIGSGIAGMGCAHYLKDRYQLTIYEQAGWIGGHTNTVTVEEKGREVPIDTGFMVYNEVTYPRLIRLFKELEVETQPTDMAFGVFQTAAHFYWCSTGVNGLFAQRGNLLKPNFWAMIWDISRFNKDARELLSDPLDTTLSLGDFVRQRGYSEGFVQYYIVPMSAAIWSTPGDQMLDFPAHTLARFFHNHGLLGIRGHLPWRTVTGGSKQYREKLIAPFRKAIREGCGATEIERRSDGVWVTDSSGEVSRYDKVIVATHADQALRLLNQPDEAESQLLGSFRYSRNDVLLHTDTNVMPPSRRAWASWNYRIVESPQGSMTASTHYWMNALQKVSEAENYFVSVNHPELVDPEKVLWQTVYEHPTFDRAALEAQIHLDDLNVDGPVYFCGSYFRYGFHEDALMSAELLCEHLLQTALYA